MRLRRPRADDEEIGEGRNLPQIEHHDVLPPSCRRRVARRFSLALQVRSVRSLVKIFAADDFLDRFRHEITNRLPAGNPIPDRRRRNVDLPTDGPVARIQASAPERSSTTNCTSFCKSSKRCQNRQLRQIILADEKEELRFRLRRAAALPSSRPNRKAAADRSPAAKRQSPVRPRSRPSAFPSAPPPASARGRGLCGDCAASTKITSSKSSVSSASRARMRCPW